MIPGAFLNSFSSEMGEIVQIPPLLRQYEQTNNLKNGLIYIKWEILWDAQFSWSWIILYKIFSFQSETDRKTDCKKAWHLENVWRISNFQFIPHRGIRGFLKVEQHMTFLFLNVIRVSTFWKVENCISYSSLHHSQFVLDFLFCHIVTHTLFPFICTYFIETLTAKTRTASSPNALLYSAHKEKQTLKTANMQIVNERWLKKKAQRTGMTEILPFSGVWKSQYRSTLAVGVSLILISGQIHKIFQKSFAQYIFHLGTQKLW